MYFPLHSGLSGGRKRPQRVRTLLQGRFLLKLFMMLTLARRRSNLQQLSEPRNEWGLESAWCRCCALPGLSSHSQGQLCLVLLQVDGLGLLESRSAEGSRERLMTVRPLWFLLRKPERFIWAFGNSSSI